MPEINNAQVTNNALRYATALADIFRQQTSSAKHKACKLACLWQLDLAQRAFARELLTAISIEEQILPHEKWLDRVLNALDSRDRIVPELLQLEQLQRKYPILAIAALVTSKGDFSAEKITSASASTTQLIASQSNQPVNEKKSVEAIADACVALTKLVEQARETCREW